MLGKLTRAQFLRRHWQKNPLLVRGAVPRLDAPLSRARLFALAARADVESRLVVRTAAGWTLEHGPFKRSAYPPLAQPGWTLLVQGVDLHDDATHALLRSFRFIPDARIDDVMVSWASPSGGVGPHVDSYDVFLLQARGRRRWRIGRQQDALFEHGVPLKLLKRFTPDEEHVLAPGDMLYLPPDWAHDGVAEGGDCITYSIGFRAPARGALAAELAQRLAESHEETSLYRDPDLAPTRQPARVPATLQSFAAASVRALLDDSREIAAALGESLSETKSGVAFEAPTRKWRAGAVALDRRTRMLYDDHHVFINGDSYRASGADARLMRRLANERELDAREIRGASAAARALLAQWHAAGWLHAGRR